MSKKEITIIIVIGIIVALATGLLVFFISNNSDKKTNEEEKEKVVEELRVGDYTLKYGDYIGYETEYDYGTNRTIKKEIIITLNNKGITQSNITDKPTVKGNQIYIAGYPMYEVTGNNKFTLLAGEGIEFELKQ